MITVIERAERFISGFEGDEMQEGIDELLSDLRAAIPSPTAMFYICAPLWDENNNFDLFVEAATARDALQIWAGYCLRNEWNWVDCSLIRVHSVPSIAGRACAFEWTDERFTGVGFDQEQMRQIRRTTKTEQAIEVFYSDGDGGFQPGYYVEIDGEVITAGHDTEGTAKVAAEELLWAE